MRQRRRVDRWQCRITERLLDLRAIRVAVHRDNLTNLQVIDVDEKPGGDALPRGNACRHRPFKIEVPFENDQVQRRHAAWREVPTPKAERLELLWCHGPRQSDDRCTTLDLDMLPRVGKGTLGDRVCGQIDRR